MRVFAARLKSIREKKHLKRYVLSERCGLHLDAIRRYEQGEATPTLDALESIADELGVSIDYLVGRTDYPEVVVVKKFF
jgi:transcriptional regulator with XRE-family HTH domain